MLESAVKVEHNYNTKVVWKMCMDFYAKLYSLALN